MSNDNNNQPVQPGNTAPITTEGFIQVDSSPVQPSNAVPIPMPIEPENRMVKADDNIPLFRPGPPSEPFTTKEQK